MSDFKLTADFDLIKENGDYQLETGYNTAIYMSLYSDKRADESEIPEPEYRSGWWGNEYQDDQTVENGSKLWLIYQSVNDQVTLNKGANYITEALLWFKAYEAIDNVTVNGERTEENILYRIMLFRNMIDIINRLEFLWDDTR